MTSSISSRAASAKTIALRPLAALLVALGGCSGGSKPVPVVAPPPATTEVRQPAAAEDPNAPLVAKMLAKVERARQLPSKHPVASRTMARAALIAQVRAHTKDEVPPDAVRGQGELLVAYGLIPPTYDYEKGVFDLLEQQLAGYYEPADKHMYLAGDLGGADADATLAHELVHALQDQHYELGPQIAYHDDAGDRSGAVHALAEGDAMSAMMDVLFAEKGMTALDVPDDALAMQMRAQVLLSGVAKDVPPVLQTSLVAPYIDGIAFVSKLRRRGGWKEVDRVWHAPPTTTEQLLHLDKYDAHEPPLAVPAASVGALGGGFRVLYTDLFGEQSLRLALEEWGRRKEAEAIAAGWGGDRASLLVRDKGGVEERFASWFVRWDESACTKAKRAFAFVGRGVAPGIRQDRVSFVCRERTDLGPIAVAWAGCNLLLTGGPFTRKSGGTAEARSSCAEVEPWATATVQAR